jgi:hypothetical protein
MADAVGLRELRNCNCSAGGGHDVPGRATTDGGLMIDPLAHRPGTGAAPPWRVQRELQLHGLATTGGVVFTTAVAGLTLGGGKCGGPGRSCAGYMISSATQR